MVFADIEAAELLMEAGEFEQAADIIINVTPLLDWWGMGRFRESLYNRIIPLVKQERQAALEQYEKSLEIFEKIGYRANMAKSVYQIGTIHQRRGEYEEALEQYEKSMEIEEKLGNSAGVAGSLHQVGMIHHDRGEYAEALEHYEKSLEIFEEIGDRVGVAQSLHQLGNLHCLQGHYALALEEYEKSLKIKEEIGDRAGMALSHGQLGILFRETKKFPEAFEHLLLALTIFAELQSPDGGIAIGNIIKLRSKWGEKEFDAAWKEKTGEEVPEALLKEDEKVKG